jgi:hypothetical protein
VYAACKCSLAAKSTLPYYFIGIVVVLLYFPLWAYRKYVEDKRTAPTAPPPAVAAAPMAGGAEP